MAYIEQIWQLKGLRKQNTDNLSDVIIGTQWKVTLVDDLGYSGSFDGATPFNISNINSNSFTPFGELTEEQVLGWIKNHVSGSNTSTNYWEHITGQISKAINANRYSESRVDENNFPWSPNSGSAEISTPA
jgi:hypothetical protein